LARRVEVLHPIDGQSRLGDRLERVGAFSPRRTVWRQRYWAGASAGSGIARRLSGRRIDRELASASLPADAMLYIGTRYGMLGKSDSRSPITATYHDGTLETYLSRPTSVLDPSSRALAVAKRRELRALEGVNLIFTMSDWVRNSCIDAYGQPPSKVFAIGAGPNLPSLPGVVRRDVARPRFIFVGKGDFERKGGLALLAAFERVRRAIPDAELIVVGQNKPPSDAPGVVCIERLDRRNPDAERRLQELYASATVFVMPSLHEPFGIAFLEAMAFGLPCVGTSSCAMPEIIDDGISGFLVSPGDVETLARRMIELGADASLALRMGEAGRRRVEERYSWPGVAGRLISSLESRLEQDPRRAGTLANGVGKAP
jgi:glycosyltransferase involved in cell wall biosynthesis